MVFIDFLTQIVNVNWDDEKGLFVATNSDNMYYGEIKAAPPPQKGDTVMWSELPMSQFNFTGDTPYPGEKKVRNLRGLSFAVVGEKDTTGQTHEKSVFIACGQFQGTEDLADTGSVLFMSNDGRTWKKTLVVPDIRWPPGLIPKGSEDINWAAFESVWDKNTKAFYVAGPANKSVKTDAGADVFRGEFMYSSPDGEHWSRASEIFIPDTAQDYHPNKYPSPSAILQHCTKPENAGPLPDGYQAYSDSTDNGTRMKSGGTFKYVTSVGVILQPDVAGSEPPPTVTIERNIKGGPAPPSTGPSSKTVSDPCWCVAYAGGVWAAGLGFQRGVDSKGAIDISVDDGKTWKNIFSSENRRPMFSIIGGRLIEVKPAGSG